jgi:hypothetical protein
MKQKYSNAITVPELDKEMMFKWKSCLKEELFKRGAV